MAVAPDQRSTRKSPGRRRAALGKPTPLADPETVVAVSRATAKAVHAVVTTSVAVARAATRSSIAVARWTAPRLHALARHLGRALAWLGRAMWGRRKGLTRIGHRLLWWGALAILVLVGRELLSADGDPELISAALIWFSAGLSMSVLVLVGAPETRMRLAAFALAGGHGSLAALAWVTCVGVS
jgi:hypothetical protein